MLPGDTVRVMARLRLGRRIDSPLRYQLHAEIGRARGEPPPFKAAFFSKRHPSSKSCAAVGHGLYQVCLFALGACLGLHRTPTPRERADHSPLI